MLERLRRKFDALLNLIGMGVAGTIFLVLLLIILSPFLLLLAVGLVVQALGNLLSPRSRRRPDSRYVDVSAESGNADVGDEENEDGKEVISVEVRRARRR